jgi:hypothetical protein
MDAELKEAAEGILAECGLSALTIWASDGCAAAATQAQPQYDLRGRRRALQGARL